MLQVIWQEEEGKEGSIQVQKGQAQQDKNLMNLKQKMTDEHCFAVDGVDDEKLNDCYYDY